MSLCLCFTHGFYIRWLTLYLNEKNTFHVPFRPSGDVDKYIKVIKFPVLRTGACYSHRPSNKRTMMSLTADFMVAYNWPDPRP